MLIKSYPQTLIILSFFIHNFNLNLNILKNICNMTKNIVYYNSIKGNLRDGRFAGHEIFCVDINI